MNQNNRRTFKDLECELHTLAIAMQAFLAILDEIAKIEEVVNRNENFTAIIDLLRDVTGKLLGFRCESNYNRKKLR